MRKRVFWAWLGLVFAVSMAAGQTISEQYLLAAANADRAAMGLAPVQADPALQQAALLHARQMAAHSGLAHRFAEEPDLAERAGRSGARFSLVTENVAQAPTAAIIHELWMQSAGHRANLLDPQVDRVGIAVVSEHGELYAVEDFARNVAPLSAEQQEHLVADLLASSGVTVVQETGAARQTCSMATGYAGSRRPWFVMRYSAASLDRLPEQLSERLMNRRYREAAVGACPGSPDSHFSLYNVAVLLYP